MHVEGDRAGGLISIQGLDQAALARIDRRERLRRRDGPRFAVSSCGPTMPRRAPSTSRLPAPTGYGEQRFSSFPDTRLISPATAFGSTAPCSRQPISGGWPRSSRVTTAGSSSISISPLRPAHPITLTVVESVYPSAEILPENLLRFYLQFSAPMSRGEAYTHIRLLDAAGRAVADPFLELNEELWSGDGRRFTLLFDPGRIKRGLKPREEVGPVLEAGKSYTLVIDRQWPDAQGNPLARRVSQVVPGRPARPGVAVAAGLENPGPRRRNPPSARGRVFRAA